MIICRTLKSASLAKRKSSLFMDCGYTPAHGNPDSDNCGIFATKRQSQGSPTRWNQLIFSGTDLDIGIYVLRGVIK